MPCSAAMLSLFTPMANGRAEGLYPHCEGPLCIQHAPSTFTARARRVTRMFLALAYKWMATGGRRLQAAACCCWRKLSSTPVTHMTELQLHTWCSGAALQGATNASTVPNPVLLWWLPCAAAGSMAFSGCCCSKHGCKPPHRPTPHPPLHPWPAQQLLLYCRPSFTIS
jgi:hypothetical protein